MNVAGRLARAFLHSKLTPLGAVAIALFGALAVLATPRTYNPDIVVPVISVGVARPGYGSEQMLNQVVRPLEGLLASLPGVDHTDGFARDDFANVTVRFKVGQDEERSLVKVYNQINGNLDRLPPGAHLPLIRALSLYDVPILTLTLSSSQMPPQALRAVADNVLEQLRSVPGVGKSWVQGAGAPAVRVWLDPTALAAHDLTPSQVVGALGAANVVRPAGSVVEEQRSAPVRVDAGFVDGQQLGGVVVAVDRERPVYLRELARIERGAVDEDVASTLGLGPAAPGRARAPEPAVTIALARKKGSNGVEVAAAVVRRLRIVERQALPESVRITVTRDDGAKADDAVNTLIEHLGIAIAAVVAILMVFLGWREAAVVALSIPLILCVVLGIGWLAGQSINRITLFALILSLGLLVDDSIVVIENIHRHLHHRRQANFGRLLVVAADEIGRPTIVATFTVILALIPMAFVTGMMGPFMAPIPFNAPIAMLASLVIAYTVVPYVAYRWLKRKGRRVMAAAAAQTLEERGAPEQDWLHRWYVRLLRRLLIARKRRIFFGVVALVLALAMLQPAWQFVRPSGVDGPLSALGVELKMLPDDNVNTLLLEIDMPTGTALEDTQRVAQAVEAVAARNRYVTDYQLFAGQSAPEDFAALVRGDAMRRGTDLAQIRVDLVNKHRRSEGSHAIAQALDRALAPVRAVFPQARIKLFESPPGPPVRSQMLAALYGPDYAQLRALAERIRRQFYPRVYGMINVDDSVGQTLPEYRLRVDRDAAALAGLSPAAVADQVSAYFHGVTVGDLRQPGAREPVPILLRLPRPQRADAAALQGLYVLNGAGRQVALSSVAHLAAVTAERPYYTHDQHAVVYLAGYMLRSSPVYGVIALTQVLSGLPLGGGARLRVGNLGFTDAQPDSLGHVQLFWLGEMRLTLDVFRDLGAAFGVALLLIYLLLVGYYRSFMMPLIVMGAIPLTLIGVFPGHWLLGQPFTATSMIGVIALAGIVVRNSLLLIDFIIERRAQGLPLADAVLEAGAVRLRPILLTALAIILGSAIMLTDPVFGGLAISLIFGAFASTALTLLVIPLAFFSWQRRVAGHASRSKPTH
ncbi:MAG: efflux RND transporter permease subunit [Gammaproteobacteria bacterium]|nr:efflux RND transporter permease subunit [Gammaproteobacteria bacterium]